MRVYHRCGPESHFKIWLRPYVEFFLFDLVSPEGADSSHPSLFMLMTHALVAEAVT